MADTDIITRFGADIGPLKKGAEEAGSTLTKFGKNARTTANQLGKIAGGAALAGAAIATKLVSNSLNAIDAQAKLAKQLKTSSESIATLDRAASMSGISLKNIEAGAKNLEVALGEAAQGTGIAIDTLERLGLTAESLEGMSLDEKILSVNAAIQQNIPATEQAAAAADLFGKKAGFAISQLDPATISEARREVVGFGVAVSDVDAAKIERANDAMATVGLAVEGVSNQFTVALAPILEAVAKDFKAAAIESGGFKTQAMDAVNGIAKAIGFLGNAFRGFEVIVGGLKLAFEGVSVVVNMFVTQLVENIDLAIQGAMNSINMLIEGVNNLPGVDISKLVVGKSALAESMRASLEGAKEELGKSAAELNALMLQPLPSDLVEARLLTIRVNAAREAGIESEKQAAIAAAEKTSLDQRLSVGENFERAMASIKQKWGKQQTGATSKMFGDLATLQQSGSKKMFEVGKAAARAQTVMSTYEGAQKAYTALAGIPIVGPALGVAAAGAAIAAGGIRLSAINSASFGGGGSVSAGAAGGGAAASTGGAASAASGGGAGPAQERNLVVSGFDSNSLITGDMLNGILEGIQGSIDDGFVLRVGT